MEIESGQKKESALPIACLRQVEDYSQRAFNKRLSDPNSYCEPIDLK